MSSRPGPFRPFRGRVWKYGDDVDTDALFPGRHTYTLRTPEELRRHALEDLDPGFAAAVRPGDVLVGGRNFGCGSSREQAVTALVHSGVGAVVAVSFGRIFFRNAFNHALPALVAPQAARALAAGEEVEVDLAAGVLRGAAATFELPPLAPTLSALLAVGGLVEHTRRRLAGGAR